MVENVGSIQYYEPIIHAILQPAVWLVLSILLLLSMLLWWWMQYIINWRHLQVCFNSAKFLLLAIMVYKYMAWQNKLQKAAVLIAMHI